MRELRAPTHPMTQAELIKTFIMDDDFDMR
jgi:hypothetical protein